MANAATRVALEDLTSCQVALLRLDTPLQHGGRGYATTNAVTMSVGIPMICRAPGTRGNMQSQSPNEKRIFILFYRF